MVFDYQSLPSTALFFNQASTRRVRQMEVLINGQPTAVARDKLLHYYCRTSPKPSWWVQGQFC